MNLRRSYDDVDLSSHEARRDMKLLASLRTFAATVRASAPSLMVDVVGLAGCASIVYGARLIYEAAGFIVAGTMMLIGAWFIAGRR
jgi:hypothetical protein